MDFQKEPRQRHGSIEHRKSLPENAQRPRVVTTFVSDGGRGQQESGAKRDHHKSRPIRFDFEATNPVFQAPACSGAKPRSTT